MTDVVQCVISGAAAFAGFMLLDASLKLLSHGDYHNGVVVGGMAACFGGISWAIGTWGED